MECNSEEYEEDMILYFTRIEFEELITY